MERTYTRAPRPRRSRLLERMLPSRKRGEPPGEYDPAGHGPLVLAEVPPPYEEIDRYWVTEGLSLVVIRPKTQRRTLPNTSSSNRVLSEFEYELLERLFEDLRDVLVLDDPRYGLRLPGGPLQEDTGLLAEYGLILGETSPLQTLLLPRAQLPRLVAHRCIDEGSLDRGYILRRHQNPASSSTTGSTEHQDEHQVR